LYDIEPHYNWRKFYTAEEDPDSPFYGRQYSEFEFKNVIYDTVIHPQWDEFGSLTLYSKILFINYELSFCIIEFLGEWNDLIYNDIMYLYRNVIEEMIEKGIQKFILIGENVHAFHADDDSYYEEWIDQLDNGWIVGLGFLDHNMDEIQNARIDYCISFENGFENWRTFKPDKLFKEVDDLMSYRLGE